MATGMFSGGAAFGNPNLARQVARTRELQAARSYDVNTLPDPQTYAFAQGFFGEAPDQLGFSRLHPDYAKIIGRGEQGMLTGGVSMIGPTAQAIKGLAGIGVRTLGPTAGRMAEGYLQRQGLMLNAKEPSMLSTSIMDSSQDLASAITEQKVFSAQAKAMKSKEYLELSTKEKAQALDSVRAKIEKTGIVRNKSNLMDVMNGEEDIANSILTNPAFKMTGVIPRSVVDDALLTRTRMKAEPATTPGADASIKEWK